MKPIFLQLVNVGPFRNEEIDFSSLDEMFLVSGKTGAGKTTIFDAMTFALYGDLSGSRKKDAIGFRSDYASSDDLAFVLFEFELYHVVYRVRRTLPSVYISKNGSEKTRPSELTFEKAKDSKAIGKKEFVSIEGNLSELNDKIKSLLNLSISEFTQIVLLPQGSFAQFLKASSQTKRDMLAKLFPIEEYKQIMDKVKLMSEDYSKKATLIDEQLKNLLGTRNRDEDKTELDSCLKKLSLLQKKRQELVAKLEEVSATQEKNRQLLDDSKNHQKLSEKSDFLTKQKPLIDQKIQCVQNANEAEKILPYIKKLLDSAEKKNLANKNLQNAQANLKDAQENYSKLCEQSNEIATRKSKTDGFVTQLTNLNEKDAKLRQLLDVQKNYELALNSYKKSNEELAEKKNELSELQSELSKLLPEDVKHTENEDVVNKLLILQQKCMQELNEAKKTNDDAQNAKTLLENIEKTSNTLESLKLKIKENEELFNTANACLNDFKVQKDLQEKNNYALALLPRLKPNAPCPVCGSLEHPNPVVALPQSIDISEKIATQEALIKKLSLEKSNLEIDQSSFVEKSSQFSANLEKIKVKYDILPDALKSLEVLKNVSSEYEKIQHLYEQSLPLSNEIKEKIIKLDSFSNQDSALSQKLSVAEGEKKSLQNQLGKNGFDFDQNLDLNKEIANVAEQIQIVQTEKNQNSEIIQNYEKLFHKSESDCAAFLSSCTELQKSFEQSKVDEKNDEELLSSKLKDSPFKSQEEVVQNQLSPEDVKQNNLMIENWKQETQRVQAQLESLKNVQPLEELEEKVSLTQKNLLDLRTASEELEKEISSETEKKTTLQGTLNSIESLEKQRDELFQKSAHIQKLNRDLDGRNPKKVPFDAWVLGMYFEEVVNYANARFERISGGRYRFKINTDAKGGNNLRGLDLLVSDSFTGRDRDTATLSGGETFSASISLALALTDVVQAQSGGIRLDSLFIDEGFGSLDPDTLDLAISILQNIQESRMVGIISHVEGLMQAIPSRIDVEKGTDGSHIHIV